MLVPCVELQRVLVVVVVFVGGGAAKNEFYFSKMSLYALSIRARYWQTLLFTVVNWKRRESEAGTCNHFVVLHHFCGRKLLVCCGVTAM